MPIKLTLAVMLWVGASIFALLYIAQSKVSSFDPEQRLLTASMTQDFDEEVKATFSELQNSLNKTVFHLNSEDCYCSKLSETHIRKLNSTFKQSGYEVKNIDPLKTNQIKKVIPSYPAIIIFDEQGNLGYLGPYSTGYLCGASNSLIEPIANTIVANKHMGATVIADGEGCYCQI